MAHGAFLLKSVYHEFPKGTIHLVAIDSTGQKNDEYLAVKIDGHYFVGTDNGLLTLVSEHKPESIVAIETSGMKSTFPARDFMAPAAAKLASGTELSELGKPLTEIKRLLGRSIKATKKEIVGNVARVDSYGNLITNIPLREFEILSDSKQFNIKFGRENHTAINSNYYDVEGGDIFVLFNSSKVLEIGIRNGSASQLLGLRYDSPVHVTFAEL